MNWKVSINGNFFITFVFIFVAVVLCLVLFSDFEDYSDIFAAKDGEMRLSEKDLNHVIPLVGEWHFFKNEFVSPLSNYDAGKEVVTFPHIWEEGKGYGTYALTVEGLTPGDDYSIYVKDMISAYELYIDEDIVLSSGVIADNAADEIMHFEPKVSSFKAENSSVIVTIKVSNFTYSPGGYWKEIKIGKSSNITKYRETNIMSQMIMFGGIVMIALYNLSLFLLNRKERAALYFSVFSIVVALRITLIGERLINHWIDDINWILATKIQFLLGYLMLGLFIMFIYKRFQTDFNIIVVHSCILIVLGFIVTLLIFPIDKLEIFDISYGIVAIIYLIYILIVLIRAIKNKRQGSAFSFIGLTFILGTTILDMILPPSTNIVPIGIFVFLLFQSLVISEKFSYISYENEILHHTATRDGMTSLFKKGHFNKLISERLSHSSDDIVHSVIFIDIDDFKTVNDTYGHDVGDDFIITISERIIRSLRNTDLACRFGGDEFIVWLDNSTVEEVKLVAQRLLENISSPANIKDSKINISASLGVSFYPSDGTDIDTLINVADERMYLAKSNGKNQFYVGD